MCFSASASFVASGGLAVVGAASAHAARTTNNKWNWLIVAIPFMFSIQQAFEGIQWLSDRGSCTSTVAGYGFLFFAFFVWPVYVPLSVYILDPKRRYIHQWFVGIGIATALFLLTLLFTDQFSITKHYGSINYGFNYPIFWYTVAGYILAVCGAPMVSSHRFFRWLGVLGLFTAALAAWLYHVTFVSVWCFFAAVMSVYAYIYLRHYARK